jgi:hypothetical protein
MGRCNARYLGILAAVAVCFAIGPGQASAADRLRPTKPRSFAAKASTQTTISVSWRASKDNIRVKGYRVFRNGRLLATVRHRRKYVLRRLRCGTRYLLMVSAYDAARNRSRPATIFAGTKSCRRKPGPGSGPGPGPGPGPGVGPSPPACPTSPTIIGLLLEHNINYGCTSPGGAFARQAIDSVRAMLAGRGSMLAGERARRWQGVALEELENAIGMPDAWTFDGALKANAAGLAVQYKVGRVIRILQWQNPELYEAAQSEKFALAAISWYIAASEYYRRLAEAGPTPAMNRALSDLKRGDEDFFGLNAYRAWGRYRLVWQRVSGL